MAPHDAPLRVGVVGLGWIGEAHLADLAARPDVTITAVADVDPARVLHCAERFGARGHTDADALLTHEPLDAVWICTPPQHHRAPALTALERGLPLYLEKPVARNAADAQVIAKAAAESGLVCAVGYQWHALDVLDALRAELAEQQVAFVLGRSIGPTAARPWFLDRSQGGGNLLERGSHHIDLVRAVAGEVEAVRAVAGAVRVDHPDAAGQDIDDALTLVLHLAGGAIATIAIAWTPDGTPGSYAMDVVASQGVFHLDLDPHFRLSGHSRGHDVTATAGQPAFTGSNSRFLAAVRAGDPTAVACTPEDATTTLRVALAGEEALASGGLVPVV
jgi:myo-inositol 2-dehydrogenase / D-chiro-inositol 1-dehydrogenase